MNDPEGSCSDLKQAQLLGSEKANEEWIKNACK